MNLATENTAFAEGFEKGLVKRALNPRIAERILVNPKRIDELAGVGRSVFNTSYKNPNPLAGIMSTGMAGYGQLRGLHETRRTFLQQISALKQLINKDPTHPSVAALKSNLADTIHQYHAKNRQQLAELGQVVDNRRRTIRRVVPMATAGLGVGAGAVAGNAFGQAQQQQTMTGANLTDRVRYLLDPTALPSDAAQTTPSQQVPSATDTGGV